MPTSLCKCGKVISANKLTCLACTPKETPAPPRGCLEILNVGAGDVKINFNTADVSETIRAKRIITDMLRRGYALIVEVERDGQKAYERVQAFDEARGEYIIADFDPQVAEIEDAFEESRQYQASLKPRVEPEIASQPEAQAAVAVAEGACQCGKPKGHRGRCLGKTKRLPMTQTRATSVGRSAGGD